MLYFSGVDQGSGDVFCQRKLIRIPRQDSRAGPDSIKDQKKVKNENEQKTNKKEKYINSGAAAGLYGSDHGHGGSLGR